MAQVFDLNTIFFKVFDDVNDRLKVDIGGATVMLSETDIQIGAVELKNDSNDNRAMIDSSGRLFVTVQEALPAGTNLLGKIQLSDGSLDVPVVSNGSQNAIPVLTDSRQEVVEVLAPVALGAGGVSAAFDTLTVGYYSNRLFIEVDTGTTIDVFYSGVNNEFPLLPAESIVFGGNGFDTTLIDMPNWANFAQIETSNAATVTVDVFRSR